MQNPPQSAAQVPILQFIEKNATGWGK